MTRSFRLPFVLSLARASWSRGLDGRIFILAFTVLALVIASGSLRAHEFKIGDLEIEHPWSRAAPEGAKVAAGYLVVVNRGSTPDRLLSVTAEIAGMADIHEMAVNADGVMTMRPLEAGLEIPAGAEVALKPGAFHIMFMDLKRLPKQGETFAGTLTFEKAGTVDVEFAVEAMGGSDTSHDDHPAN